MHQSEYFPSPWDRTYREDPFLYKKPLTTVQSLAQVFHENGVHTVLDLGCGNGHHLLYFARLGFRMTGCDLSR